MDKTSEYDMLIFKETKHSSAMKVLQTISHLGSQATRDKILPPVKEKKKRLNFLVTPSLLASVICVRWHQKSAVQSPTMEQLVKRNNIFPQVGRT